MTDGIIAQFLHQLYNFCLLLAFQLRVVYRLTEVPRNNDNYRLI